VTNIDLNRIKQARERIASAVRRPPLERSRGMSIGERDILLKLECLQLTGSFKIRGATARLTALTEEEKARGLLTVSAGNHGLAIAHAAEALGLDATVIVPTSASRTKVDQIRRYPVTLIEHGVTYNDAENWARRRERETGITFIPPYNDPDVIAGQGTIGLEILEDAPELDAVLVPIGGGGLIAGVAAAIKETNPRIKVYGVEPQASPTMIKALEAGEIIEIAEEPTIADGLSGNIEPESITFPIIQRLVDDILLVSEEAMARAIATTAREEHLIIEASAATGIAALDDDRFNTGRTAVVVTGRNIAFDLFKRICASSHE